MVLKSQNAQYCAAHGCLPQWGSRSGLSGLPVEFGERAQLLHLWGSAPGPEHNAKQSTTARDVYTLLASCLRAAPHQRWMAHHFPYPRVSLVVIFPGSRRINLFKSRRLLFTSIPYLLMCEIRLPRTFSLTTIMECSRYGGIPFSRGRMEHCPDLS